MMNNWSDWIINTWNTEELKKLSDTQKQITEK